MQLPKAAAISNIMASESTLTINVVERSQDSGTETPSISENASVVSRSPRACARVMPASFVPRTGVEVKCRQSYTPRWQQEQDTNVHLYFFHFPPSYF